MSIKKRLIAIACVVVCIASAMTITALASGSWSSTTVLSIPGFNGSSNTKDNISPAIAVTKGSSDTQCSLWVYSSTSSSSFAPDGRLINDNYAGRSSWIRNLVANASTSLPYHADTTGLINYYYYWEMSSDLLQINTNSINFRFSADNNLTKPT